MPKQAKPAVERFWEGLTKQENGCWVFSRGPLKYGLIAGDDGKSVSAHRFSYRLHKGEIPRGLVVRHKCDVKGCVNPDHLELGTHEDNTQDIIDRKRQARNTARRRRYAENRRCRCNSALDAQQREQVRAEYASGQFTQMQLAARWRVSQSVISYVVLKRRGTKNGGKKRTGFFRRKLDPSAYEQIRDLYSSGQYTQNALAERFGIDQTYVSVILKRGR